MHRVMDILPHLGTADRPMLKAWCQLEYLADQVYAELRTHGVFSVTENGERIGRRLLEDFRKLRVAQLPYANSLGLTPMARVQIKAGLDDVAIEQAQNASERIAGLDSGNPENVAQNGSNAPETLFSEDDGDGE